MKRIFWISGVLAFAANCPAWAATTVYTDQTSFQSALSSSALTLLNFDNLATAAPYYTNYGQSTDIGGVQFIAPDNLAATNPAYGSGYDYGLGTSLTSYANTPTEIGGNSFTVALPNNVSALGFYLGNTFAAGSTSGGFTFNLSDGSNFSETPVAGTAAFYGFVSSAPIASLTILNSTPSDNPSDPTQTPLTNLMRFEYAVSPVPEPAEWLMMALGIALLGGWCKGHKRAATCLPHC